ncbi:MAG: DUF5615 family PIN-like protein [Propionibacteriaceae bacterium]|jgi:predicted nuclease of predicted toxin-antitoxin system|nr:DUF5615 family PIN-like protein [Propionibacteriaceae bacterium]
MTDRLLLDEHFSPVIARILREEGFDVVAVLELPTLRKSTDRKVYEEAVLLQRRIVTEDVAGLRSLLWTTLSSGEPYAPLLITNPQRHSRHANALGALLNALREWLTRPVRERRPEEWL